MNHAAKDSIETATGDIDLSIEGMNCSNCVRHVTDALQRVPGVASALVSLEEGRASVRANPDKGVETSALIEAVKKAGYGAALRETHDMGTGEDEHLHTHAGLWGTNVLTGIGPTVLLMAGEWVFRLSDASWWRWLSFGLASVVQFGPGRHFYRG